MVRNISFNWQSFWNVPFWSPWKHQKNLWFSDVFREIKKEVGKRWVITTKIMSETTQQKLCLKLHNVYLFKVNNINTRKRREIYSKLTIKKLASMTSFGVFLLSTLSIFYPFFYCLHWWIWTSKCWLGKEIQVAVQQGQF